MLSRPRRSVRDAKFASTITSAEPRAAPRPVGKAQQVQLKLLDYDAFLKQHGIEEKKYPARHGGRRSTRTKIPKRSYSSDDVEDDEDDDDDEAADTGTSSDEEEDRPKVSKGSRSSARKPPAKKQATASFKTTQRRSAKGKQQSSSNSSDTDDFAAEVALRGKKKPPPKNKTGGPHGKAKGNKKTLSSNDSNDSSNDSGAMAFTKTRKKSKRAESSDDSDEMFRKLPADDDDDDGGDDNFIIDKVLAKETHTAAEWAKKCHNMHTHYVSLGSIFVDDDEDVAPPEAPAKDSSADGALLEDDADNPVDDKGIDKFLIKWRNLSYLHVTWETEAALVEYEKNAKGKIQRFLDRSAKQLLMEESQGDEYFNPEFCTVDRILTIQPTDVPDGKGGFQMEYYVKWKALPYDECTWEQEVDVHDDAAVQLYYDYNKPPPSPAAAPAKRKTAQFRPYNNENPLKFKTDGLQLRDYQVEGVNWMIFNWYNHRNSLLADEMGLGKTVQTVTFINHLATKENLRGPYLIIAPLSTLSHWQREVSDNAWRSAHATPPEPVELACWYVDRYTHIIESYEFYRPTATSHGAKSAKDTPRYRFDVLITTFEMCTANDYLTLARIKWQLAVVDEAHRLKNKKSKLSSVLQDRYQYDNLLLLTGTPLQNNVEELWTLLHFLDAEKFQSVTAFSERFGDLKDSAQVENLHTELKPFLLRRMKEDVEKSLAPKEETIIEVELTVFQKQYYRAIYEKNSEFLAVPHAPSLMNVVMELRKCCNHPFLIQGAEEREIMRLHKEQPRNLAASTRREAVHKQLNELLVTSCGKLVLLDKLLPRLREGGHRVLIFSQFKIMLNILEDYLRMRGYPRERIDGSITGNDRQAAIDRYCDPQRDSFVMLLSTRAGGVGINLTAADTCIIYDSDWNPQNDLQAQARCHRIGQDKSVKVYRLLTSKTYELHMFHQASMKLGLDQAVLGGIRQVHSAAKGPSKEEIENLLKYGAYEMFKEDDAEAASKKFNEESVDEILKRSKTVIHDPKKVADASAAAAFGSSFSKATFVSSENPAEQVALDDPDFWIKVIGLTGVQEPTAKNKTPEKRRCRGRKTYEEIGSDDERHDADAEYKLEEASESSSSDDDGDPDVAIVKTLTPAFSNVHRFHQNFVTALLSYGYGRWTKIRMSDPILTNFSVVKIKDYAMGFLVQMIRVAVMDPTTMAPPADATAAAVQQKNIEAGMTKLALKYKFVVYWLHVLHREETPASTSRELFSLHKIPVQEELTRLNVVASLAKTATKYLQLLESLFILDQFIAKRLSPMLEVMAVVNMPYESAEVKSITAAEETEAAAATTADENNLQGENVETNGSVDATAEVLAQSTSATSSLPKQMVQPEVTAKWTHYLGALYKLPAIPVVGWWSSPQDDIRLLYCVHRYGWLRGSKSQFQQIRSDRLLFPPTHPGSKDDAPWPSIGTLNRRLKAILRYWAEKSISSVWSSPAIKQAPPATTTSSAAMRAAYSATGTIPPSARTTAASTPGPPPNRSSTSGKTPSQVYLQQMWERRTRFMGLVMSHGVPDVRLCSNAKEEHEKWRYFLFDPVLRAKHFSPQELLAEATSLEEVCRSYLKNVKPLKSTERSVFGAYRHDWVVTEDQARGILYRIELFALLRRDVLIMRPADLYTTMVHVVRDVHQVLSVPSWWKSPECDILLMQGVECFGLDDNVKDMWELDLFRSLNPTGLFPSVSWVDSTVMACARGVVRARRAAEAALHEQHRQQREAAELHAMAEREASRVQGEPNNLPSQTVAALLVNEADVRDQEMAAMAQEDPHCSSKAFMWYLLQKREAELKAHRNKAQYRYQRDLVQRQIEQERQFRERELARRVGLGPSTRVPEIIEIDDSD
ncbi:hypothetical protein DYB32_006249 [Aphanomyces invadans]|uniref:Chromodomain-helicase-DNA-binding protein 6 n=1 Tax=Aphanomyces invadans TaxID=157072 RepID=A0A3R7A745_9STRA|nr:hypothetical protein DYB32_006249 [Aphanomyces invadans]